jgi:hypothetical protein
VNVHWEVSLDDWNETFQNLLFIEWQVLIQNLIASNFILLFDKTTEFQSSGLFVLVLNINRVSPVRLYFSIVHKSFQQFKDINLKWLEVGSVNYCSFAEFWWLLALLWLRNLSQILSHSSQELNNVLM